VRTNFSAEGRRSSEVQSTTPREGRAWNCATSHSACEAWPMVVGRRNALLGALAFALPGHEALSLPAERVDTIDITSGDFDMHDLFVEGDPALASRFALLSPKGLPRGTRVPLVVALHGLGEAYDENLGVRAWAELYGLKATFSRLRHPPIERVGQRKDLTDPRIAEVNGALAQRAFRGVAVACPFTPHIAALRDPVAGYDAYTKWIADVVLPRARQAAKVIDDPSATAIVGCSMGGPVALEVFSRRPELFGSVGLVQGAVASFSAERHATQIAKASAEHGPRDVLLLSSTGDPYRDGHMALDKELTARSVKHTLLVPPGPHDQPWLRDVGSLEMLLYHDSRLP